MATEIGAAASRFRLESHNHDGKYLTSLPYRNLQGEWMLGAQGHSLRGEIPYRGYAQVTPSNFYAGKHEVWLYDSLVSATDPIFAGPVWDATASSSGGTINFSAQCPLSHLAKQRYRQYKLYTSARPTTVMADLITYMNSIRATNIISTIAVANASTVATIQFLAADRLKLSEMLDNVAQLADGTDYYFTNVSGKHTLNLYGGYIKPSSSKMFALEYGGSMDGYSVQYNAQTIAADFEVIASNGLIGRATDTTKYTEYDFQYMDADTSELDNTADLNTAAAAKLKDTKNTKVIPSMVTRKLIPWKDFTFGDQFTVSVNDWYVNLQQLIRVTGWQLTIGQGDKTTTVLYTKDTDAVS